MDLKKDLRKRIINERTLLSGYELQSENEAIIGNVLLVLNSLNKELRKNSDSFIKLINFQDSDYDSDIQFINSSRAIGLYLPFKGEPDLTKLMLLSKGWSFALPKLGSNNIRFVNYQIGACLEKISFKSKTLSQPVSDLEVVPYVIIAPGLAYSIDGYRLGYGAGCYDKYLSCKKETGLIVKIGVCFDEYLLESLPYQDHDIKFDYIITDRTILKL